MPSSLLLYASGGTGMENFLSHPATDNINDRCKIVVTFSLFTPLEVYGGMEQ